jgi:hypothetical protein
VLTAGGGHGLSTHRYQTGDAVPHGNTNFLDVARFLAERDLEDEFLVLVVDQQQRRCLRIDNVRGCLDDHSEQLRVGHRRSDRVRRRCQAYRSAHLADEALAFEQATHVMDLLLLPRNGLLGLSQRLA